MAIQSEHHALLLVLKKAFWLRSARLHLRMENKLRPQSLVGVNSIGLLEVILEGNQFK